MLKRKQSLNTEEIFLITNNNNNNHITSNNNNNNNNKENNSSTSLLYNELIKIGSTVIINSIDDVDINIIYFIRAVIFDVTCLIKDADISWIRRTFNKAFIIIFDPNAAINPEQRLRWFDAGANMVSHDIESLLWTLTTTVLSSGNSQGIYTCPYCQFHTLTEDELREHMPMYHINWPNAKGPVECPICRKYIYKPIQVHIHEDHGSEARHNRAIGYIPQNRAKLESACLVVCYHPIHQGYLLVQTFGNEGFWLPGGFLQPCESFQAAAQRECLSQCGIHIDVKGILSISHTPNTPKESHVLITTIMYAEPINLDELPKSIPDFLNVGSCWGHIDQLNNNLRLKGTEVLKWISHHHNGGIVYPLSLIFEKNT